MAAPDPATTEWVPVWNPVAIGPTGPMGPQGPAGGAVASAKYWLVEPFGGLVNARALNAFGNGYVKSTVGEPSVVATIPLTDTTGILPDNRLTSNVALKNIDNRFVPQTFAASSIVFGDAGIFYLWDSNAPLNQKVWRWVNYHDGNLRLEKYTDDLTLVTANFYFQNDGSFVATKLFGDGSPITNLNASNLAFGTVPLGRLGTNAPTTSTFLRGDNTWATAFPSGMIAISATPCPVGWTRVTVWDGLFLRSGPTSDLRGGANTHTHDAGSYGTNAHSHGGQTGVVTVNGNTAAAGDHAHSVSAFGFGTTNPFNITQVADAGSDLQHVGAHSHDFSVTVNGSSSTNGSHAHSFTGTGVGAITAESVGVGGNSGAASSLPPFVEVFFCQKN